MIKSLDDYLVGFVIGTRYRKTFSIADNLGSITDEILQSKQSDFKCSLFPCIQHSSRDEDILFDLDNNKNPDNRLTVNTSNIVLDVQNIEKISYDFGIKAYNKTFLKNIMVEYNIRNINRIGFIKRYMINDSEMISRFMKGTVGNAFDQVNDINLQFSKRLPLMESLAKQDQNHYQNVIINIIKKNGIDELFVAVDFQLYFSPTLTSVVQIEYEKFIKSATDYINTNILDFLNKTYGGENE